MRSTFLRLAVAGMLLGGAATAGICSIYGAAYSGPFAPATLYNISFANGGATAIGPVGFGTVSALDFAPNGTLYGVGTDGTFFFLLTINTSTGAGTIVGPTGTDVNAPFQDIAFRPSDGTLFGYSLGFIYTINTTTGAATLVGSTGAGFGDGNGLAFSSGNVLYTAFSRTTTGSNFVSFLQTIDQSTGAATTLVSLTASFSIPLNDPRPNAMKFDKAGTLWASVVSGFGGMMPTNVNSLATIDIVTGALTFVGPTVTGLDAIAVNNAVNCDTASTPPFDLFFLSFFFES